jgi:hypothetical protein
VAHAHPLQYNPSILSRDDICGQQIEKYSSILLKGALEAQTLDITEWANIPRRQPTQSTAHHGKINPHALPPFVPVYL